MPMWTIVGFFLMKNLMCFPDFLFIFFIYIFSVFYYEGALRNFDSRFIFF